RRAPMSSSTSPRAPGLPPVTEVAGWLGFPSPTQPNSPAVSGAPSASFSNLISKPRAAEPPIVKRSRLNCGQFGANSTENCGFSLTKFQVPPPHDPFGSHRFRGWSTLMLFARFFADRKGGVAPLLALGIVPLVAAVGASIDYSRASSARAAMQAAGDAAALMLARSASNLTPNQMQSSATAYFMANFTNHPEAQGVSVTATYGQGQSGFTVTIGATATVQTSFLGIWGYSQIPISTTGVVNWNNAKLRVALVLDNTGSMSQSGKLAALKTASHNLLTQLKNAAQTPGDVYVSIIPFVKDINAGASNYNQSWIDWDDWEAVNGTCSNTSYSNRTSCTSHSKSWTPKKPHIWNGGITARQQTDDRLKTAP